MISKLNETESAASAEPTQGARRATEAKSNEIADVPRLLELLHVSGCIVTIDAMGCQMKIAEQIIDQGADYVLALKGNQGTLAAEVEEAFIDADAKDYAGLPSDCVDTVEQGHGRRETRRYRTLGDLASVAHSPLWKAMNMIGMVESERELNGKISRETRFYIGSIGTDAATFARALRAHWGIDNSLHWSLDMAFARMSRACATTKPARTSPCCAISP